MQNRVDWDLIGYIKASKYRHLIITALSAKHKTPKELSEDLSFYISHVSTILRELVDKELVVCLNPKRRKGKLFALSEEGKKILNYI